MERWREQSPVKSLIGKSDDLHLAMFTYWATPLEHSYGPVESLTGRKLHIILRAVTSEIKSKLPDQSTLKSKHQAIKQQHTRKFDIQHGVCELPGRRFVMHYRSEGRKDC